MAKNKRKLKKKCSKCLSKKGCTLTPKLDCWCFTKPLKIKFKLNKDNCKFYDKNNCSVPCSWYKCNMVEMGRKNFVESSPYLKKEKKSEEKKKKTLFQAFTKGFTEGMTTIISVFDIPSKDVKEKLHTTNLVNRRIFELYNLWMGF